MPRIEVQNGESRKLPCLAVSLEDLDNLDHTLRAKLIADKLDLQRGIIRVGEDRKVEVPAIALCCETKERLRIAALACDILRENDRKQGRNPIGVYIYKETWTRIPWNIELCVVTLIDDGIGGEVAHTGLNPELFGSWLADKPKPPPATPVPPSTVKSGVDLNMAKRKWGS